MRINSIPPKELYYQYVHVKEKAAPVASQNLTSDKVELTSKRKNVFCSFKSGQGFDGCAYTFGNQPH